MSVVDGEGRLFGVVNVIDLVVAVVVVSTLVAGAAFVFLDDSAASEQRYLTVVLDDRPDGSTPVLDSDAIRPPDGTIQLGQSTVGVTDSYVAPAGGHGAVTIVRLRVNVSTANADRTTDRRLVTDGDTFLVGQEIKLADGEADYAGYIHAVGDSGSSLSVRTVNASIVVRVPSSVAERVQPGDIQRVAGREVARVTAVERRATDDGRTRVQITVALRVLDTGDGILYGTRYVRPGAEVAIAPDGYEITGMVTEVR